MQEKHVSSILFFLLFIVLVCNNIKAQENSSDNLSSILKSLARQNQQAKGRLASCESAFTSLQDQQARGTLNLSKDSVGVTKFTGSLDDCQRIIDKINSGLTDCQKDASNLEEQLITTSDKLSAFEEIHDQVKKEFDRVATEINKQKSSFEQQQSETREQYNSERNGLIKERDNFGQQLDELKKERRQSQDTHTRANERLNRCLPYICGTGIAVGADCTLSCLSKVERLANDEHFKLLHQSVQDTKRLENLSLFFALVGGKPHTTLNSSQINDDTPDLGLALATGAKNVAGETINAFVLRLGWNKLITHPSIASHLKKIGNYRIVKAVPEPVKQICQSLVRSLVIRKLWDFEKAQFGPQEQQG